MKLVRSTAPAPASALANDGIPVTALRAYESAAAYEASRTPGCRLSWPLLAAIGRVESDHGRFGGAVLQTDGESTRKIIGIPLDGRGTALVLDTDHGRLDGDTTYDRAVGPMQFIPSTWLLYGVDGNGDGKIDPFNIVDAAFTAARYLCAAGGDLSNLTGQIRAVSAYNHSAPYLRLVLGLEGIYAGDVPGLVVPVLPAVIPAITPPAVPPANQGPPLATSATVPPRSAPSRTSATTSAISTSPPAPASSSTPGPSPSTAASSMAPPPSTSAATPTPVAPTPSDSSTPPTPSTPPATPTTSATTTSTPATTDTPTAPATS